MKEIFYIKDSIENKISYFHLLLFLIVLPFDGFYSSIILVSFLIHILIFLRKTSFVGINKKTFIIQSVFMVSLFSMFYAPSLQRSFETISNQLALFLFPVLFALTSLDLKKYRPLIMLGFTLSCTLTVIYLYFDAIHVLLFYHLSLKNLLSWMFVNHNFSLPINMHATYLSMLLALSIIFSLQQLFNNLTKAKRIYFITSSIIQFAGLIQLGSKSVLFSLLIIILVGFPWFLVNKTNHRRFLFISAISFSLFIYFILSFQIFRERYLETLKDDLYENKVVVEKNGRADRWHAALDLIRQSPLLGTGTGSEIPLLRETYFERKMYGPYLASLNAHNQYLSFMINSGVFGLIIYLMTISWGFRQSIKYKDIMLLGFLVLITIVSFSEDLLDVNKGIFIYAFFFSFFIQSEKITRNINYAKIMMANSLKRTPIPD